MAKFTRLQVLISMIEIGVIPVFYHSDPEIAANTVLACAEGGARCFEFTNRGDQAQEVFGELIRRFKNDRRIILGVGSILDPSTAALFIQMGANFIVGPILNAEVARLCNRRKIAYSPGCGSASEVSQAEELGVEICKIFPGGAVGGPAFIKDLHGPMPWARLMPTGGVNSTQESITSWIQAGADCVGMGSKLFTSELIASENYGEITEKMKRLIGWVQTARNGKLPI